MQVNQKSGYNVISMGYAQKFSLELLSLNYVSV